LKVSLDLIYISSAGSAYQTAGHAKENAHSANLVRMCGLMKVLLSEEHRLERHFAYAVIFINIYINYCSWTCTLLWFGVIEMLKRCVNHHILWEVPGKPFDGCPFLIAGHQRLNCQFGPLYASKYKKSKVIHMVLGNV